MYSHTNEEGRLKGWFYAREGFTYICQSFEERGCSFQRASYNILCNEILQFSLSLFEILIAIYAIGKNEKYQRNHQGSLCGSSTEETEVQKLGFVLEC